MVIMNLEEKLAMELGARDLQIIKLLAENEKLREEINAKALIIEHLQNPEESDSEPLVEE